MEMSESDKPKKGLANAEGARKVTHSKNMLLQYHKIFFFLHTLSGNFPENICDRKKRGFH